MAQCTALACPRLRADPDDYSMSINFSSTLVTRDVLGNTWCNYCSKQCELINCLQYPRRMIALSNVFASSTATAGETGYWQELSVMANKRATMRLRACDLWGSVS